MAFYFHCIPGRIRVKSIYAKRNEQKINEIIKKLSAIHGIFNVEANSLTGSFLINYDKNVITEREILKLFENEGIFDSSKALDTDTYIERLASKAGNVIGKTLFSTFLGKALEGTPLAFLSIVL